MPSDLLLQVGLLKWPGNTCAHWMCSSSRRSVPAICDNPHCSLPGPAGCCKELCLHIVFVMVRVLRVPASNPLAWQLSLTDRELEEVLRYAALPLQPPAPPPEETRKKELPKGGVKRKALDEVGVLGGRKVQPITRVTIGRCPDGYACFCCAGGAMPHLL